MDFSPLSEFVRLRKTEIAWAQAKLALRAIGLQEQKAAESFFAAVRKATPQVRVLGERYGGDVSFNFDSNGRSVWVVALFGKGAPPTLRTVSDGDIQWSHLCEDQEEGDGEGEEES